MKNLIRKAYISIIFLTLGVNATEFEHPSLGGPQTVENTLVLDQKINLSEYKFPLFNPYFDWKKRFETKNDFSYGVDYTFLFRQANKSINSTKKTTSGGIIRFYGAWKLINIRDETTGRLIWRVGHHNGYTDISPSEFSIANLGYIGAVDPLHDNKKAKLNNLYWKQDWNSKAFQLIVGYHDVADFIDVYALTDPHKQFTNLVFLTGGGTISLPSSGSLGVNLATWLTDNIYLQGGLADLNADATDPLEGFHTLFSDKELFTYIELGMTTSKERAYLDNIHLTLWHSDSREAQGIKDGQGIALSYSQWIEETYMPFVKIGYSNKGSSLYERSISTGIGIQPNPIGSDSGDLFAIAFNWAKPNTHLYGDTVKDQFTTETFYRWQIGRTLALTANIQWLKDPALNPSDDDLFTFGLRGRMAF